jgi:hypothetical protein
MDGHIRGRSRPLMKHPGYVRKSGNDTFDNILVKSFLSGSEQTFVTLSRLPRNLQKIG